MKEEDTSNTPTPAVEQGDTPNTPTSVVELGDTDLIGEEQQGTEPQKQETTLKYVNIHPGSNLI